MSTVQVLPIPLADVNASFASRWNFSPEADEWRAAEWADLDAMPETAFVPMPAVGSDLDPAEARQALQWVDCLPREDRHRLVEIAAERLGIDRHGLPTIDELRAALDRPEPPRGLAEWRDAIDSASRRKKPISGGIHRWRAAFDHPLHRCGMAGAAEGATLKMGKDGDGATPTLWVGWLDARR